MRTTADSRVRTRQPQPTEAALLEDCNYQSRKLLSSTRIKRQNIEFTIDGSCGFNFTMDRKRWRFEQAFSLVKRLLGLSYL